MPPPEKHSDAVTPASRKGGPIKRILKFLAWTLVALVVLVVVAVCALYVPAVQNVVRGKVIAALQEKIGTPVRLERIVLRFPIGVALEGLYVEDQHTDTLLYAGSLRTRASLSALLAQRIELATVELRDVRATILQGSDSAFNFTYILKALKGDTTASPPPDTSGKGWSFSVGRVELEHIALDLDLRPSGTAMTVRLGELNVGFDRFELDPLTFHVDELAVGHTRVDLRTRPGASKPDTYPQITNPLADIDIRFKVLRLEDIGFSLKDVVKGDSLWLALTSGKVTAEELDMAAQRFALGRVELDQPVFGMLTGTRDTGSDTLRIAPPWLDQHDGFRFYIRDRNISVDQLLLRDGSFAMYNDGIRAPKNAFDTQALVFDSADLDLGNVIVTNERIAAEVRSLSATSASGDRAQLAVAVDARPNVIDVRDGRVNVFGNAFTFAANAAIGEPSMAYRKPDRVPLRADVHGVLDPVTLRPLLRAFGADTLLPRSIAERWNMDMLFRGSLATIDTVRADLVGDRGSVLHVNGSGTEPARWPTNELDVDVSELTLGEGFGQLVRAFTPPDLVLPKVLRLTAHVRNESGAVSSTFDLRSDLGDIQGTASASGWSAKLPDNLGVDLKVRDFATGRFTHDTAIGKVSLTFTAEGHALNSTARSGRFRLKPSRLSFKGNDLSSLVVDGRLEGDSVHVDADVEAEALFAHLAAHGRWPSAGDSLSAIVRMDVDRARLQPLGLMAHELNVDGSLVVDAAFDASGYGRFRLNADSLRLANTERAFRFAELRASGVLSTDSSTLNIFSDALTLNYRTNVPLDSLVPVAREKFASYFRADSLFAPEPGKYMDLEVTLPKSDPITGLIVPELSVLTLETLTAHYDGDKDELALDIVLPEIAYQHARITDLQVHVDAVGNRLTSSLEVQRAAQDSLFIEGLSLTSTTTDGGLETTMRVQRADEPPSYQVGVLLTRESGGLGLHVEPEGLLLNGTAWTADPLNKVRFLSSGPASENFTLSGDGQGMEMATGGSGTRLTFDRFRLGTVLNIVRTGDSTAFAGGELTGDVAFRGSTGEGLKADLTIAALELLGHPLGDLQVSATEPQAKHYRATMGLLNGQNKLDANVDADVSGARPVVDAHAELAFNDIGFLEPFAGAFLYELGGGIAGDLRFRSQQGTSALEGDVRFQNARMGVSATGSLFHLRDEAVHFDGQGIHLDKFTLRDSLDNTFTLDGDIHTTDFRALRFDLTLRTDSFQLTRQRVGGNDLFHGDVFTKLDLAVTGTSDLPVVKGDIGVLGKTDLSIILPGSRVSLVSSEGVVVFTDDPAYADSSLANTDSEMLRDSLKARLKGIELDLGIHVDKRAAFTIVLDPTTGDAATFKGEGDLRFNYNAKGEMYLSGPFTLAEGGYTLEFYGLVKKRFELVEGSTVVWDGDPLAAVLGIKARYRSESAAYPLVASTGSFSQAEENRLQQRLPFDVIISVDGSVSKPEIDFAIDLERSYRNSYPQVSSRLDQLAGSSSRDERTKQVFGLLVLNSFIQDESSGGAPSSGIATSAARNSVNGILTDQMNKLTGKYIKGVDISLGVNTVDQAEGNTTYQRTSVDYKVSKSFLNERLSFEVGGSVGVDEQKERVGNVSSTRAAQYVVYYDLTRNGRFRLRGFYENAFDLYDGNITDSGVAIMYTRDFEENETARTAAREAETKRRQEEAERKRKARDAMIEAPAKP